MSGGAAAAAILDGLPGGSVLVIGSLPPSGRDLDVLARPAESRGLREALAAAGFACRGGQWARFDGPRVLLVDVLDTGEWGLEPDETEDLFAEARPVPGYRRLLRPAPHHDLLVLAALLKRGSFAAGRRPRLARAVNDDPLAWQRASARAPGWGVERELAELHAYWVTGRPPRRGRRPPRPRRPHVVAFCGIDGSGKSSQAQALQTVLTALGWDARIEWSPLASNAWLDRVAAPVKRAAARVRPRDDATEPPGTARRPDGDPGTRLRADSSILTDGWALLVSAANAGWQLSALLRHLRPGRVVIFDRYYLDSVARLRFFYGPHRRYHPQRVLLRLAAVRPVAAFFLDVDAPTSLARKDDGWTPEELELQVRLYREEARSAPVVHLDGSRPMAELAVQVAETVWRRLR